MFLWKWWMCSFPAVPKDPDSLTALTSVFVTQHFISVVSAYEHQANHLLHSVEIGRFFENSDIASFWCFKPLMPETKKRYIWPKHDIFLTLTGFVHKP